MKKNTSYLSISSGLVSWTWMPHFGQSLLSSKCCTIQLLQTAGETIWTYFTAFLNVNLRQDSLTSSCLSTPKKYKKEIFIKNRKLVIFTYLHSLAGVKLPGNKSITSLGHLACQLASLVCIVITLLHAWNFWRIEAKYPPRKKICMVVKIIFELSHEFWLTRSIDTGLVGSVS